MYLREQTWQTENASLILEGLNLLVVDDNLDTRDLFTFALEEDGAEVVAVASVKEALDAIAQNPPDVLLCDIQLGQESGYSLISKLRSRHAEQGGQIPAVAVTGYAKKEDRLAALAAGFQRYLTKPVDLDELTFIIASLMGRLEAA